MSKKMRIALLLFAMVFAFALTACDVGSMKTSSYFDTQSTDGSGEEEWPPIVLSAENVHFEFVSSGSYDSTYFKESNDLEDAMPYSSVKVIDSPNEFPRLQEDANLQMDVVLDREKYSYIITFGRRIIEAKFDKTAEFGGDNSYKLLVTVEEEHQGDTAFLYRLNKLRLISILTECYIMKGDEKISTAYCCIEAYESE